MVREEPTLHYEGATCSPSCKRGDKLVVRRGEGSGKLRRKTRGRDSRQKRRRMPSRGMDRNGKVNVLSRTSLAEAETQAEGKREGKWRAEWMRQGEVEVEVDRWRSFPRRQVNLA